MPYTEKRGTDFRYFSVSWKEESGASNQLQTLSRQGAASLRKRANFARFRTDFYFGAESLNEIASRPETLSLPVQVLCEHCLNIYMKPGSSAA